MYAVSVMLNAGFFKNHVKKVDKMSNLENIMTEMLKVLKQKQLPIEHQLWNEQDIAEYFKYTLDYTKRNIIAHPNFPPSRDLPTSIHGERYVKRWKASDVIAYAMAFDKSDVDY